MTDVVRQVRDHAVRTLGKPLLKVYGVLLVAGVVAVGVSVAVMRWM